MADRVNLPSRKPFERTDNGYLKCPECQHTHRHSPPNAKPDGTGACYLRALISSEMKQQVIDSSREDGLSISAFVRKIFVWYFSQRQQGKL
jgi:hypothetical protein